MATRHAVYELKKIKGKKAYVPVRVESIRSSLNAASWWLKEYVEDELWRNINWIKGGNLSDIVEYEMDGNRLAYIPNIKDDDSISIYGRRNIYYVDEYPNPYSYYKLHKNRNKGLFEPTFVLEGIKE